MSASSDNAAGLVARGYDTAGERYDDWACTVRVEERQRYTDRIVDLLPHGASILELGCGSGIPTTRTLAQRFFVTGVDLSPRRIEAAEYNVPNAWFRCGDMTEAVFEAASFDAVIAFYSMTHVPRDKHAAMFASIRQWLRPGGYFIASLGSVDSEGIEEGWLGVPMYFSHFDAEKNQQLVREAGFEIVSAIPETAEEHGTASTFLWVVARKP